MDDECWTGDHEMYTFEVALPALILWGFGLPAIAFFILYKHHRVWNDAYKKPEALIKYGFLYLGYKSNKYWWEMIILSRKIGILITIVWLGNVSVLI